MKLSLNWLKDYIDPKLTAEELSERLTMAGLEVEAVHAVGKDVVFDLEITPNRPDCLNTIGLAREVSAITAKNLKLPKIKEHRAAKSKEFSIAIEDQKDCSRYIGTLLKGVEVDEAGTWVSDRINAIGIRSINNAVDITNFVLMELGQPLHAFDFDKLIGGKIVVRRAKAGEKLVTLDGIERALDPSILVIADAQRPVAIAGIMGGQETAVSPSTQNILLESAHFDMGIIRRASRTLGLKSDSSYRFERGVDMENVVKGADRACDLLIELTGGKVAGRVDQSYAAKRKSHTIAVTADQIEGLLGTHIPAATIKSALTRLGLGVSQAKVKGFKVSIPSFRGDLKQSVDLIEEVARVMGYDRLDSSFPHIQVLNIAANTRPRQVRHAAVDVLTAQGYSETITFSLIGQKDLDKTGLSALKHTQVRNALSQEHNIMRPSMLPSMLSVVLTNVNRGQKDLKLFEAGKRYYEDGQERSTLAIIATGVRAYDWRRSGKEPIEFYDVKGAVEQFLRRLGLQASFEPAAYAGLTANTTAHVIVDKQNIGALGQIDPAVLSRWDIKVRGAYFAEIDLEALNAMGHPMVKYTPIAEFPAITRDISVAVTKDISYAKILRICRMNGGDILKHVHLIEEYTGEKIQSGYRGLVFSLQYQSAERTLREEEVNATHQRILTVLSQECRAVQR